MCVSLSWPTLLWGAALFVVMILHRWQGRGVGMTLLGLLLGVVPVVIIATTAILLLFSFVGVYGLELAEPRECSTTFTL